jgi:pimeloyl-ACP methyl ester carboxylesterase
MPFAAELYYQVSKRQASNSLVLLHGSGGSHLSWPPDMRRLAGYNVYALDLPGHGKSAGSGQQSIVAYVDAVREWMQSIPLHRAIFVGHSMGGAVAQKLALDTPEHTLGLGLFGCAARLAVNPQLLAAAGSAEKFDQAIQAIVAWSISRNADQRLKELVIKRMADIRPSVLHGDLLACNGFDISERVSEIQCPTLVVCGAEDRMTPVRNSQFLADHIPVARLEIVPGAGHMVMLENPEAVSHVLVKFLDALEY